MNERSGYPATGQIKSTRFFPLLLSLAVVYFLYKVLTTLRAAFFGPLSKSPDPKLRAISVIPKAWSIFTGDEGSEYVQLHKRYGPVVRIAPDELSYVGNAQVFKEI